MITVLLVEDPPRGRRGWETAMLWVAVAMAGCSATVAGACLLRLALEREVGAIAGAGWVLAYAAHSMAATVGLFVAFRSFIRRIG